MPAGGKRIVTHTIHSVMVVTATNLTFDPYTDRFVSKVTTPKIALSAEELIN